MALTLEGINLASYEALATVGYPWREWDLLRCEAPVHWYAHQDVEPFWAITKHADILEISGRSDIFINGGPRLRLGLRREAGFGGLRAIDAFARERGWDPNEVPDLVYMDAPRHNKFRSIVSRSFTPRALRARQTHLQQLADGFAAEFEARLSRGPADFVRDLAVKLPLAAICELFDLPPDDWRRVLTWSNALTGDLDPAYLREGEDPLSAIVRALREFRVYLHGLAEERSARGLSGDNLLEQVVGGRVDGAALTEQQINGFLLILIAAGNETTRNATAGGLIALLEHPAELQRLCAEPALLDRAIEEMLRWTSPVYHFFRTVTEDYELRGVKLAAGDAVGLFYPSANRDEEVFDAPYRFDITRRHNPHLAFGGHGAHYCLGANLARAEMRATFTSLLPLLPKLELAGKPVRNPNLHVPGYRSVPVRLRS